MPTLLHLNEDVSAGGDANHANVCLAGRSAGCGIMHLDEYIWEFLMDSLLAH